MELEAIGRWGVQVLTGMSSLANLFHGCRCRAWGRRARCPEGATRRLLCGRGIFDAEEREVSVSNARGVGCLAWPDLRSPVRLGGEAGRQNPRANRFPRTNRGAGHRERLRPSHPDGYREEFR